MTVGHLNTPEGITHLICQNILRSLTVFTATVTPFSHTGATSLWGISSDLPPVSQPPFMTLTVPDITTKEQLHTSFFTACPYHPLQYISSSLGLIHSLLVLAISDDRYLHPHIYHPPYKKMDLSTKYHALSITGRHLTTSHSHLWLKTWYPALHINGSDTPHQKILATYNYCYTNITSHLPHKRRYQSTVLLMSCL